MLDGLRNLLPFGVTRTLQVELSTLVDAYKQAEALPQYTAAVYTMSSILTDQAEPSEALKATVVWSTGLENAMVLLSEDQVDTFCNGLATLPVIRFVTPQITLMARQHRYLQDLKTTLKEESRRGPEPTPQSSI